MKKTFSKLLFMCGAVCILSGCASTFGDNARQISIKSHPSGANVYINGVNYGSTPTIITLPSYIYGGQSIIFKKPGYQDTAVMIGSKFQPVGLLNIFFWPGFLIDAATGNTVKIDPANLNVETNLSPSSANLIN